MKKHVIEYRFKKEWPLLHDDGWGFYKRYETKRQAIAAVLELNRSNHICDFRIKRNEEQ